MRVLLDECLPRRLKHEIVGHDVATVPEMGWAGVKNGELLRLAAEQFDAFVTVDQGIGFQQNLVASSGRLAVPSSRHRVAASTRSGRWSRPSCRRRHATWWSPATGTSLSS